MIKPFIYNASIERIAAKARVADNDTELSAICEQLNVANKIFLGKIDLWLAKQALSAVYRTLKKYPALRNIIHYFGTLIPAPPNETELNPNKVSSVFNIR